MRGGEKKEKKLSCPAIWLTRCAWGGAECGEKVLLEMCLLAHLELRLEIDVGELSCTNRMTVAVHAAANSLALSWWLHRTDSGVISVHKLAFQLRPICSLSLIALLISPSFSLLLIFQSLILSLFGLLLCLLVCLSRILHNACRRLAVRLIAIAHFLPASTSDCRPNPTSASYLSFEPECQFLW